MKYHWQAGRQAGRETETKTKTKTETEERQRDRDRCTDDMYFGLKSECNQQSVQQGTTNYNATVHCI